MDLVARRADGWSTYGGPEATSLPDGEYWAEVARHVGSLRAACARRDRDPETVRKSLLLGFGRVRPLATVASYVECVERAASCGLDELAVYWTDGPPGTPLCSDPEVLAEGVARVRG